MMDQQDNLADFEFRLVNLRLDVEKIVVGMQAESEEARRALTLYGRTRRLLNSFLGQASGHQVRACHLGQRMAGYSDQIKVLHHELDSLVWRSTGEDKERLVEARRELHWIAGQIKHWSVESDGLE